MLANRPKASRVSLAGLTRLFSVLLLALPASGLAAASAQRFDVPAGDAATTLRVFAQQSGEQILFPADLVRGRPTQAVRGTMTDREALDQMLAHSGLAAVQDAASGAFVIKRAESSQAPANTRAPASPLLNHDSTNGSDRRAAAGDIVMLSAFEVKSRSDIGYKAANSVSATRMAVPMGDLPMTVTAFTSSFIADQKPYDLYDVVKWSPGVHQDNVSPQGWVRYNIRGFTSAAVQRNGFSSFRFIDTSDIERVEVVKGPASLLYGQINPGGVINYITKRPMPRQQVELDTASGDHGYDHISLDATGPVPGTGGALLYRGIAMFEDIPQFQVLAHAEKYLLAPSATWRISDHATVNVAYEHFTRIDRMPTGGVVLKYVNGIPTLPYPNLPWDFNYAGNGDYQNFRSDAVTAEFTARAGDHISVRATYVRSFWNMEWRASGQGATGLIPQSFIDYYYPPSAGLTSANAMFRRNRWEHQWGGDSTGQVDVLGEYEWRGIKFRALLGERINFNSYGRFMQKNNPNVAGSPFYLAPWDLRNPATWSRAVPFGLDALILASNTRNGSDAQSTYGVLSAAAFDGRLHLLAGFARHQLHNDPVIDYLAGTTTSSASDRAADVPQAGALYQFVDGVSGFVSYSESFLANGTLLRVNNVLTKPAQPSIGRGWETGLKLDTSDGRLSGTISAYRVRASPTGVISVTSGVDSTGTTLFTDIQGGSQLSQGVELDLLWMPLPELQVMGGFNRCDAVYEQHPTNPALNGTPLVATPDRTYILWGKYTFEHGRLAGMSISGGANYVGSMAYVGNNPNVRFAPYTTIDATLGYRFRLFDRRWSAELTMKNVTDVHYYVSSTSWGFPRYTSLSLSTKF